MIKKEINKKIIKYIKKYWKLTMVFLMLILSTTVFAVNLGTSTTIPELGVGHKTNGVWQTYGVTEYGSGGGEYYSRNIYGIKSGDTIVFQIHAYANGGDVSSLVAKIENIDNKIYSNSKTVTSSVSSSNAGALSGAVTINFSEKVMLKYSGYDWYVENVKKNLSNDRNVLEPQGVFLGNLNKDEKSNLLVYFDVIKQASNCSVNGINVQSGTSKIFYKNQNVPYGSVCESISRTCNDGNLSGSSYYIYQNCTVAGQELDTIVYTENPTSISSKSGTFNSSFQNVSGSGQCYFEWGRSVPLANKTFSQDIDLNSKKTCTFRKLNLAPGTKYYYRVVLRHNGIEKRGEVKSFVTHNIQKITPSTRIVYIDRPPKIYKKDIEITKWVSLNPESNFKTKESVRRGDNVYYKIKVRNNKKSDAKNIIVTDEISSYLELDNRQTIDDNLKKIITWELPVLKAGASRILTTQMRLKEETPIDTTIVSHANIKSKVLTYKTNDVFINVIGGAARGGNILGLDGDINNVNDTVRYEVKKDGDSLFGSFLKILMTVFVIFIIWLIYKIFTINRR